jgi:hypothetical protein
MEILHSVRKLLAADPDLVCAMLRGAVQALMSAEADERCGADYGERSAERVPQRLSAAAMGHPRVPKPASWGSPESAQDLVPGPLHLRHDPAARGAAPAGGTAAGARFPQAAELLEEASPEILAYANFPQEHWRQRSGPTTPRSGSTRRSAAAPMWSASSPTGPR